MGLESLEQNREFFSAARPPEEQVIPLSAGDDGEFWQELVNVRLRRKGIYQVWEPRHTTKLIETVEGNILTVEAFRAIAEAERYRFLMIHTDEGALYYYDLDDETITKVIDPGSGDAAFTTTGRLYIVQAGKFVYLFDPETQENRIYDITNNEVFDWMSVTGGEIIEPQFGPEFISAEEGEPWPEQNCFGFREGAGVIAIPYQARLSHNRILVFRTFFTEKDSQFWFYFEPKDGRENLITSEGEEIDTEGWYFCRQGVGLKATDNEGTDPQPDTDDEPDAYYLLAPGRHVEEDRDQIFDVFRSRITGFYDETDFVVDTVPVPEINDQGTRFAVLRKIESSSDPEKVYTAILPDTPDLEDALEITPKFETDNSGNINERDNFSLPELYRGYAVVNIMADGSYSLPGRPIVASTNPERLVENRYVGVKLDIPEAPEGVTGRLLLATRWHLSHEDTLKPSSERYPNGRWFVNDMLGTEAEEFIDYKSDSDLMTEAGEEIPMQSGISLLFASGELKPRVISQYENSLFLSGYDISRQEPEEDFNFKKHYPPHSDSDLDLLVHFEYTDGTTSEMVTIGKVPKHQESDNGLTLDFEPLPDLQFYGLNALIRKVYISIYDGADYYKVDSFTKEHPEFNGYPVRVIDNDEADISDLDTYSPDIRTENPVSLRDHILLAVPLQQTRIDQQVPLSDGSHVQAVVPLSFDQDKTLMRFRLLIQTDRNVQVGYITEQTIDSRSVVQGDFETIFSSIGTQDGYGARKAGGAVYLDGERGIYAIPVSMTGELSEPVMVVDRYRYPDAASSLAGVVSYEEEGEVWLFLKGSNEVFIVAQPMSNTPQAETGMVVRRHRYGSAVVPGFYLNGQIFGSSSGDIIDFTHTSEEYDTGVVRDYDGCIAEGEAISRHILSNREQVRILTFGVTGQGVSVQPDLDLQVARKRNTWRNEWERDFNRDVRMYKREARMFERLWDVRRQAIMPRIRMVMEFEHGGELHGMRMRYVPIRNTGMPNLK